MDFDVVVVGAGPGGCLAARDFSRAGLSVGVFDADGRDGLGKDIIVEAEREMFKTVSVRAPEGEEVPYHQERMRVFSGRRKEVFTLEGGHPAMSLKLSQFSRRLLSEAESAGAKFFGGHRALRAVASDGRVRGVVFRAGEKDEEVKARLVIDASGFNAALVRGLDPELGIEFADRKADVVIAENHFHRIDEARAKDAVNRRVHLDDEVWNRLGVYGNFSTEYSYLSLEQKRAYILIGLKASYDQPPVSDLVDRFREEQGYYGEELYGGKGPIRVRRSLDRLVAGGLMVVGEAACMVIPAHGSGVSSALYAGWLAARVAAPVLKSGGTADASALWPYCAQYQRGRGAVLACYDANKLLLEFISHEQEARLLESGAMQGEDLINGAVPKPISMSLKSLPARVPALIKNPDLIKTVIRMGSSIGAVKKHYGRYPAEYDPASMAAWKQEAQKLFAPLESG